MNLGTFALVSIAGGLGAVARWALDVVISARVRTQFAVGIFVINVVGSFALGVIVALFGAAEVATVVGVGFLGGFTTFSTVAVASATFAEQGMRRLAIANIVATFVACVLAAFGGLAVGQFAVSSLFT